MDHLQDDIYNSLGRHWLGLHISLAVSSFHYDNTIQKRWIISFNATNLVANAIHGHLLLYDRHARWLCPSKYSVTPEVKAQLLDCSYDIYLIVERDEAHRVAAVLEPRTP